MIEIDNFYKNNKNFKYIATIKSHNIITKTSILECFLKKRVKFITK